MIVIVLVNENNQIDYYSTIYILHVFIIYIKQEQICPYVAHQQQAKIKLDKIEQYSELRIQVNGMFQ